MDIATAIPTDHQNLILTMLAAIAIPVLVISLAWMIVTIIGHWKLFEKAGQPGWKSIIPIYNEYCIYKIGWNGGIYWINLLLTILSGFFLYKMGAEQVILWVLLAMLVSLLTFILRIVFCIKLAQAYNKNGAFALGLILIYPLFVLILAFGDAEYVKNK